MPTRNSTAVFTINCFKKIKDPNKPCETMLVPLDLSLFDDYLVTIKQFKDDGEINKTKLDCETGDAFINVKLTQEETSMFVEDEKVKIQVQFFANSTKQAVISTIKKVTFSEVLNEQIHQWN